MARRSGWRRAVGLVLTGALLGLVGVGGPAEAKPRKTFEVWALDQSNSPGADGGGLLSIYDGRDLVSNPAGAVPEVVDLAGAASALCRAETGATPVRGHSLLFNRDQRYAIVSFVASGHVLFMDTARRAPVKCLRMTVGAGGARQAHAASPAPNDAYVLVANQNGKLLERIDTDANRNGRPYEGPRDIVLDPAATLDLATCTTPNRIPCETPGVFPRPNNALVGPMIDEHSALTFLTLAGGGMLVVDTRRGGSAPPIVGEYDNRAIRSNGFGGMQRSAITSGRIYLNSGAGDVNTSEADLYSLRLASFPRSPGFNPPNTPAPKVVFSLDAAGHDSHGTLLLDRQGARRFLWAADRPMNTVEVVETTTDRHVGTFDLASRHSADPAPELLDLAPGGAHAFVSLRGPCPATGNIPGINNSVGDRPGVGVLRVRQGGRSGTMLGVAPMNNVDPSIGSCAAAGAPGSNNRADVHAIAVRKVGRHERGRDVGSGGPGPNLVSEAPAVAAPAVQAVRPGAGDVVEPDADQYVDVCVLPVADPPPAFAAVEPAGPPPEEPVPLTPGIPIELTAAPPQ